MPEAQIILSKLLLNIQTKYFESIIRFDSVDIFVNNSRNLYKILLKPVEGAFRDKDNIFIVPDRFLRYLTFESLLSSEVPIDSIRKWGIQAYSNLPYLIKKYNICYETSITNALNNFNNLYQGKSDSLLTFMDMVYLLERSEVKKDSIRDQIVGLPFIWYLNEAFKNSSNMVLPRLMSSLEEQYSIVDNFSHDVVLGYQREQAIEDRIKQSKFIENFKYIYLGTYAIINELNPSLSGIVFAEDTIETKEDGYLNLIEIFNLKLNADLIAISKLIIGQSADPDEPEAFHG